MEIKLLKNTSHAELTATLNEAFSDYMVPAQWTEETAARKFKGDNFDLSLSPGFFDDGKLCGFIFHGVGFREGKPVVWNGGTGVIPAYRGQGITSKLYEYIIPVLRNKGFSQSVLEVIEGNDPAIHIYKKHGFENTRKLDVYKGKINSNVFPEGIEFKDIHELDWSLIQSFRDWEPTFQNNNQKIDILKPSMKILGAFEKEDLVAYIIFDKKPDAQIVYQFAVNKKYRKRGIGKGLFARAGMEKEEPLKIVNVDAGDDASKSFFINNGFEKLLSQIEMLKVF